MVDEVDMEKTLRSVREAYRFLHEFQKRLRDTIDRFVQEFDGYSYCGAYKMYSDVATFRKNPHELWALDLLPAYSYGLQYQNNAEKYSSLMEITYYSDSEFDEENFDGNNDSLPSETENSITLLEVLFWVANQPKSEEVDWKVTTKSGLECEFTECGKVYPDAVSGIHAIRYEIDIKDLIDEKSIIKQADFVKKGIIEKFKEKNEDIKIYL